MDSGFYGFCVAEFNFTLIFTKTNNVSNGKMSINKIHTSYIHISTIPV